MAATVIVPLIHYTKQAGVAAKLEVGVSNLGRVIGCPD
jgi:hypothetical protein